MDAKEVLQYLSGIDVLQKGNEKEAQIYRDHDLDPTTSWPLDGGLPMAIDIHKERIKMSAVYTGTMVCRLTGIDAAYRGIKQIANRSHAE